LDRALSALPVSISLSPPPSPPSWFSSLWAFASSPFLTTSGCCRQGENHSRGGGQIRQNRGGAHGPWPSLLHILGGDFARSIHNALDGKVCHPLFSCGMLAGVELLPPAPHHHRRPFPLVIEGISIGSASASTRVALACFSDHSLPADTGGSQLYCVAILPGGGAHHAAPR